MVPLNPDGYVPMCVKMSGQAVLCPAVLSAGQPYPVRCRVAEKAVPHLHCILEHVHFLDREGNILDAPAGGG
jgi:hypothetical protein